MKTKALTRAVRAGMAVAATFVPAAQAMNLNPLGTGQVLIYPYYTVSAGNQTLISVVNKTDKAKAVKVRFREGRNAREVLAFNVYLSPFDVWTAVAFSLSDTGPDNPGNLVTTDNSCTVPRLKGSATSPALSNGNRYRPFYNYTYTGADNDAGPDTLDRTREGYFEMIEMGEVTNATNNSLIALTHGANGIPANCSQIERAWLPATSAPALTTYWTVNASADMDPPQGGLFGTASIVDALAGTMMSYNAEAIDGFSDIVQHTVPGTPLPSLASARTTPTTAVANVFSNSALVSSAYPLVQAIDAVSALFVQNEIFNEFVTSPSVGGASEWVVTFPTKFAYTDEAIVGLRALPPFTRIFPRSSNGNAGTAAIDVKRKIYNREEGPGTACEDDPNCFPFPGWPPPQSAPFPQLFWASNVISFNQPDASFMASTVLGSRLVINLETVDLGVFDGWASLRFYATTVADGSMIANQRMRPDQNVGSWQGLPVTGFLAVTYTNGQLTPGVLSNYAGIAKHRGSNRYETDP